MFVGNFIKRTYAYFKAAALQKILMHLSYECNSIYSAGFYDFINPSNFFEEIYPYCKAAALQKILRHLSYGCKRVN